MLSGKNRLVYDSDFERLFKTGRHVQGSFFRFFWLPSSVFKLGVVVSNKISKNATERNRIKRVIRNFFQEKLKTLPHPLQFVVVARPSVLDKTKEEMLVDLQGVFERVIF